ncbi:hypothetical protein D3C72_2047010 [compost metagenome]
MGEEPAEETIEGNPPTKTLQVAPRLLDVLLEPLFQRPPERGRGGICLRGLVH